MPKWHKLRDTNGKPGAGEILTSIQVRQDHGGGNAIEFISAVFIETEIYSLTSFGHILLFCAKFQLIPKLNYHDKASSTHTHRYIYIYLLLSNVSCVLQ